VDFLVKRDDLTQTRIEDTGTPEPGPGEALLRVESFALTANNVTYGVFGDMLSYWDFFPAPDGWGRIPAFGFAEVVSSPGDALPHGSRFYGYYPWSTHLAVTPSEVGERGFVDAAPHRASRAAVYNAYRRVDNNPNHERRHEDRQALLEPLFGTAFLIDDWLDAEGFFGAGCVVVSSASSKTSIATAHLLRDRDAIETVGLTSAANRDFVERLDVYDAVAGYDEIDSLPLRRSVYVDVSGSGAVRSAVHRHYDAELAHSSAVGGAHWDRIGKDAGELSGPDPVMFFAPDRVRQRTGDWGEDGLRARIGAAWAGFVPWTESWLEIEHGRGPEAVESTYRRLLEGEASPAVGHVLSMSVD
jgi:hypothetical protein